MQNHSALQTRAKVTAHNTDPLFKTNDQSFSILRCRPSILCMFHTRLCKTKFDSTDLLQLNNFHNDAHKTKKMEALELAYGKRRKNASKKNATFFFDSCEFLINVSKCDRKHGFSNLIIAINKIVKGLQLLLLLFCIVAILLETGGKWDFENTLLCCFSLHFLLNRLNESVRLRGD